MSIRVSSLVLLLLGILSFVPPARAGSLSVAYNFILDSSSGDNAVGYKGQQYVFQNAQYTATPEPQTLILLGSGLLVITAALRRKYGERGSHRG